MHGKSTGNVSRSKFLQSERAVELRNELVAMTKSSSYNTRVVTLASSDPQYFVEKHMKYMSDHLTMDHFQYVRNLKLMTKIR